MAREGAGESTFASAAAALRDVLSNRGIRRIEVAWTTGTAADWALLVVLLVVAYEEGGTVAAGILGAVRVVPGIVAAPFATSLVERFRGDRVLTGINVVRAGGAVVIAIVVWSDLPFEATYLLAALVAGAGSLVRPIQTALLPAFARTPRELVAANVASSTGEGVGTFVGPLVAGILVAATGSVTASLLVAAAFAGAAAAVTGVRFEYAADARGGSGAERPGVRLKQVPALVRRYPTAALLNVGFVTQVFVRGLLITFIVVAAIELLEMGESGVGLLNAAFGLGGFAGAILALGLQPGRRLATIALLALAGWGLPLLLIGAWPAAAVALAALFVTGISNAVLDVSGFTLVQRGVGNEDRVTVFGVMEGLFGVGLLAGSLLAPVLLAVLDTRAAFAVAGALLPLVALLISRPIIVGARAAASREEQVGLLRRNPLFALLPLTVLDRLAESMHRTSYGAGDVLMEKGEPGEEYVLIADGIVDVRDGDRHLRSCEPGDGVGEIALLRRVPRTATVTARTNVTAYAIDGATFLAAVAGPTASAAADAVASARLAHSRRAERPSAERKV